MKEIVVRKKVLLNQLAKAGHITLHEHTGKPVQWYGHTSKAWYVDNVNTVGKFEFRGRFFIGRYVSGCFFPYVFEIVN